MPRINDRTIQCTPLFVGFVLGGLILLLSPCASAETQTPVREDSLSGRMTIMEENDKFASHDDRHYTQGVRLAYLSGPVTSQGFWDQPFIGLSDNLPIFGGDSRLRKIEGTVGQSIFTPTNTLRVDPSGRDRPYGAWLYLGGDLLQETKRETHHTLESAELLMGVVGSAAMGGVTQNDFHQFIGDDSSLGWKNQLKNEPGFVASYERKWRFQAPLLGNLAIDAIPELGASVGNVLTYGQAGLMARFGQNLAADYGPEHIRPSLSGTGWFDANQLDGDFGWYVFAGSQGRVVGQNIMLDGNTFISSASVNKKPLVADFTVGASLFWSSAIRLDLTAIQRTKEFETQQGHPDRFGGINIAFRL